MKWQEMRKNDNVEDVRRASGKGTVAGGVGLGGIVIALLAALLFGVDPSTVMNTMSGGAAAPQQSAIIAGRF